MTEGWLGLAAPDKGRPCPPGGPDPVGLPSRPPATGRAVSLAPSNWERATDVLFTARYRDETYAFRDGSWGRFGRDDAQVHIVVWEELRGTALSRIAGELWCAGDEMWVRNLSSTHELEVAGKRGAPQALAPRSPGQRGRACSVPPSGGQISAPTTGGWQITVQGAAGEPPRGHRAIPVDGDGGRTRTIGPVPDDLLRVAAALCAPILLHGDPPASYEHIASVLGLTSRQARRKVERLCDHYRTQVPDLLPCLAGTGQASYAAVAQILVARGRISRDDLAVLSAGRGAVLQPGAE